MNKFISKTNRTQSRKKEKGIQLAWPCFTHSEWHYCSFNSYSVLLHFEISSPTVELKRPYENGNEEIFFCSMIIPYSQTIMHTHSSSLHHNISLDTGTPPPSPEWKKSKNVTHAGLNHSDETYAGAINRTLPGFSPPSSPLQMSSNRFALGKCYINSKS